MSRSPEDWNRERNKLISVRRHLRSAQEVLYEFDAWPYPDGTDTALQDRSAMRIQRAINDVNQLIGMNTLERDT